MKPQITQFRCCLALLSLAASLQLTLGYYDPAAQRWINRDPVAESGFRLTSAAPAPPEARAPIRPMATRQELNLSAFVGNNPVGAYDPLGLKLPGIWSILFPPSLGGNNLHCLLVGRTDPIAGDSSPGGNNHNGQAVCIWRCNRFGDEVAPGPPSTHLTYADPGQSCPLPKDPCGGKIYDDTGKPVNPDLVPPSYE